MPERRCQYLLGGTNVTLLLVADVGTLTGTADGSYYAKALQNNVTRDPGDPRSAAPLQIWVVA